jgi:hypothetical protein
MEMVRAPLTTSKTGQISTTERAKKSSWKIAKHSDHNQLYHHQQREAFDNDADKRKMWLVTEGLSEYIHKQLTELYTISPENALTIVNYILTQKTEVNIADTYRLNILSTLVVLSKFLNHKSFIDMMGEDILLYLDSLRKPEASDPLHKWIGTYNEKRQRLVKFFRWLYNPNKMPSDRPTPEFLKRIPALKRTIHIQTRGFVVQRRRSLVLKILP